MNAIANGPDCKRQDDLISFLYGETTEGESTEFEQHLRQCVGCQSEMTSFGLLRDSIGAWKHEALSGYGSPHFATTPHAQRKTSAVAALREFFSLSPLWMKGAVAFATVIFCLLAVIALGRLGNQRTPFIVTQKPGAIYTREELENAVKHAIEERFPQENVSQPGSREVALVPQKLSTRPSSHPGTQSAQAIGSRRPLSRTEREQLAADLRLTNSRDENGVELLGDRINY